MIGWFRTSITLKVALLVLLGAGSVLGVVLAYGDIYSRRIILDEAESGAKNLARSVAGQLDQDLLSVVKIVNNFSTYLEFGDRDDETIRGLIRKIVEENREIYGSTVAFEPYFFDADLKAYAPYYFKSESGLKLLHLGTDSYNYFAKPWYKNPRDSGKPGWSQPYFDEGGGDVLMVTYSCPFFRLGEEGRREAVRGIVTADLALDRLTEMVATTRGERTGFAFVISDDGTFLAHPQKELVLNQSLTSVGAMNGDPRPAVLAGEMLRDASGFVDIGTSLSGEDSFLAFARLPSTGWSLGVIFPKRELFADVRQLHNTILVLAAAGVVLLLGVSYLLAHSITVPLKRMAEATRKISEGELDLDFPDLRRKDEVGRLARSFVRMAKDLKKYISDLTAAVAARQRVESELSVAATIQRSMLPQAFPAFPGRDAFDIHAVMHPAKEVGGDFYDFFPLDDDRICIAIGDVSDKGVPAALFMAVTKYLVEASACGGRLPAELLEQVNAQLSRGNDSCMFVTMFVGVLDLRTGELTYASGGHDAPLLVGPDRRVGSLDRPIGPVLGFAEDATFGSGRVVLPPGGLIVAFTDGVTEAVDPLGVAYTEERLRGTVGRVADLPARDVTKAVLDDLAGFCGDVPPTDDVTLLVLRYRPGQG